MDGNVVFIQALFSGAAVVALLAALSVLRRQRKQKQPTPLELVARERSRDSSD